MLLVQGFSLGGLFKHLSNHRFGVRNFGNTKAMKVIFFSKRLKFQLDFKKAAKNREKVSFSEIIASELVSLNCLYYEQDSFHWEPMC